MTHTEHTPWWIDDDGWVSEGKGDDNRTVAVLQPEPNGVWRHDAKLIVKAVNSHQILIDALTEIADNYDLVPSDRERARAALALAEGETP